MHLRPLAHLRIKYGFRKKCRVSVVWVLDIKLLMNILVATLCYDVEPLIHV